MPENMMEAFKKSYDEMVEKLKYYESKERTNQLYNNFVNEIAKIPDFTITDSTTLGEASDYLFSINKNANLQMAFNALKTVNDNDKNDYLDKACALFKTKIINKMSSISGFSLSAYLYLGCFHYDITIASIDGTLYFNEKLINTNSHSHSIYISRSSIDYDGKYNDNYNYLRNISFKNVLISIIKYNCNREIDTNKSRISGNNHAIELKKNSIARAESEIKRMSDENKMYDASISTAKDVLQAIKEL